MLGDEARLRQVLVNLLGNALTHTPPRTPVDGAARARADRSAALLEVEDRGPGLSPEQTARVFERFYRADTARTRAPAAAAGWGCRSCGPSSRRTAAGSGCAARPGAGATFAVELPLGLSDARVIMLLLAVDAPGRTTTGA